MGRGGKKGKRGGGGGRGGRGGGNTKQRDPDERTDLLEKIDMENARFFAYYKAQRIVPEDEWEAFVEALRRHLPVTFRVAGSRETATTLNALIQTQHVPALSNVTFEGERVPPPEQLPWYPDGLAWQFNVPKKVLRRSPEFKKFHSFLVFETEVGNISRQEAVSMLPPLFLEVEPHHKCMDMCAAPGSKTAQILESLHSSPSPSSPTPTSHIPTGLLIANDSDNKRTHLLIHQSARLPSPALMVTNLDASAYPSIKVPLGTNAGSVPSSVSPSSTTTGAAGGAGAAGDAGAGGGVGGQAGQGGVKADTGKNLPGRRQRLQATRLSGLEVLLFDRILCDVPCSGDGTLRKNVGIWKTWGVMDGNGLHSLQLRILQRAMNMLKDNGRIVYSTCSLNPVENEAVVAAALLANKDFHLLPTPHLLPTLLRRPGLTSWAPTTDRTCARTFESYDEFMASDVDEGVKGKMTRGHWPPEGVELGEGGLGLGLERCMRIYPHLQDTGGFFVAVFEKHKREKAKPAPTERKRELDVTEAEEPNNKRARVEGGAMDVDAREPGAASASASAEVAVAGGSSETAIDVDAIEVDTDTLPSAVDAEDLEASTPAEDVGNIKPEEENANAEEDNANAEEDNANADEDEDEKSLPPQPSGPTMMVGKKLARGEGGFKENPYTFLSPDDPILVSCLDRLHINRTTFPTANVLVRNPSGDAARSLYLANDIVKAVITHNSYERLRLTSAGTKVFAKQEGGGKAAVVPVASTTAASASASAVSASAASTAASTATITGAAELTANAETSTPTATATTTPAPIESQFRVLGEGLPVILPYVDESSIIEGDMGTLRTLVEAYYPLCATFGEPFRGVIEARPSGSHIVRFPLGNLDGASLTHDLFLPIWKSNVSLTLMIDKKAKSALSLRLFGADITTVGKQAQATAAQKAAEAAEKEKAS